MIYCCEKESESLSESIKSTMQFLLKLRDIDDKLIHLKNRMEDGPRILGKRSAESSEVEDQLIAKKEEITQVKLNIKTLENDLSSREADVKKQEVHLLSAKSNQEYKGHQDEIARLKGEISGLEEQILFSFEENEVKAKELKRLDQELEIHKNELADFKKEIEEELAEYASEIEDLESKRKELADNVDLHALQIYEKVKDAREGVAVACADGKMCHGCFMSITANDLQRLMNLKEIVVCKSCQRILYLTDMVGS